MVPWSVSVRKKVIWKEYDMKRICCYWIITFNEKYVMFVVMFVCRPLTVKDSYIISNKTGLGILNIGHLSWNSFLSIEKKTYTKVKVSHYDVGLLHLVNIVA